jgi:hypothetical protein
MADITTNIPGVATRTSAFRLKWAQLLLLSILACGCWVAVNEATAKDRCQTTLGRVAVRLKLDSYYSGCRCMQPGVMDFSDPCNLPLAVAAGVL